MKSKDISKYNLAWQVTRVECRDFKTVGEKIAHAENFLNSYRSRHNFERVINWLEGLRRGYIKRDEFSVMWCDVALERLRSVETYAKDDEAYETDVDKQLSDYSLATLHKLYKDLEKRSLKWLAGGYIHPEQEAFLDLLGNYLIKNGVALNMRRLLEARHAAKLMPKEMRESTFFF